jgi:hypothetical protein
VLDVSIRKTSFDPVEAHFLAERDMIYLKRVVEEDAIAVQKLHDVTECVMGDMEVAWHALHLNEAYETTALL